MFLDVIVKSYVCAVKHEFFHNFKTHTCSSAHHRHRVVSIYVLSMLDKQHLLMWLWYIVGKLQVQPMYSQKMQKTRVLGNSVLNLYVKKKLPFFTFGGVDFVIWDDHQTWSCYDMLWNYQFLHTVYIKCCSYQVAQNTPPFKMVHLRIENPNEFW